jgi:hypothetical protein
VSRNLFPALPFALTFALGAALAGFALAAFSPGLLNDGDTYWHIRAGEWMLAHRAVLRSDIFSYTMAGAPWHTQEWLAEILMALGWIAGGWQGIHLLFAVFTGLTAGLVGFFVRKRLDMMPALLTVVLGLCCVSGSLLARPHMLTLPLLALWVCGLVAAREQNRAPPFWLIVVMPLWANLHGSFAFGLALAGALGFEAVAEAQDRKKVALAWGLFLLAAAVSSMATPFGYQTLLFPFHLSGMQSLANIGEWQASDLSHLSPLALALLTSLFVLGSGRVKVAPIRLLLFLGLIWLALGHVRHQMLLGVAAPILLAPSLAKTWPARSDSHPPLFGALAAAGLVALIAVRLLVPVVRGDDAMSPVSALAHVPPSLRETRVLNDYAFGGYLIWTGIKVFIDSRADFYGDSFLQNYAGMLSPDRDALAASLNRYQAHWTIFSRTTPMAKLMDTMPGWRRLYSDELATVHVREDLHH